jgi:signal transduction histidine kinase
LVALAAGLLAINAFAIWEIVAAGRGARRQAERELELRTTGQGRALEALLANLRGDLVYLTRSAPLSSPASPRWSDDPVARRWRRLDLEGALLLFAEAHPAVEALVLRDGGEVRVVVGRRAGVPLVLPAAEAASEEATAGLTRGEWALPGPGAARLEAWIEPGRLLRSIEPAGAGGLRLHEAPPAAGAAGDELAAVVEVGDARWQPPLVWWLEGREAQSELERSVAALAGRYRTTVLLNLAVIGASLLVGLLALRQARDRARAEAAAEREREVRELERRLAGSERLASVGRLAAGIAHEVNNPLEGMANFLSLLESELAAGRPEAAAGHARKVGEGLTRTAGIVRQVLAFSDPGRAPKETLELRHSVEEAAGLVRGQFGGTEIEIAGAPDHLLVTANRIGLGQLFFNLLLNACQAQDGRGRIEVRLARDGEQAVAVVADRGPGIEAWALPHLFEPFFSTRGSTGLGLAVCHGIVHDHGGEIAARNRAGGGAEFEVRLPLAARVTLAVAGAGGGGNG